MSLFMLKKKKRSAKRKNKDYKIVSDKSVISAACQKGKHSNCFIVDCACKNCNHPR